MSDRNTALVLGLALVGIVAITQQPLLGVVVLPVLAGLFAAALERWFGWIPSLGRSNGEEERKEEREAEEQDERSPPPRNAQTERRRQPAKRAGRRRRASIDDVPERRLLVFAALSLAALGLLMSYAAYSSASAPFGAEHYLQRTVLYTLLGVPLMFALSRVSPESLGRAVLPLLLVSLALLLAARIPGIGQQSYAGSWLTIGGLSIDPAQLAQVTFVVGAARFLTTRRFRWNRELDPAALFLLSLGGWLLVFEWSLGIVVVLTFALVALLVVAGIRLSNLVLAAIPVMLVFTVWVLVSPWRLERVLAFLDPGSDPQGTGFQTTQSLIAIGSGGIFGLGFQESVQRALYLPGAEAEFAMAILAEELGLLGMLAVLWLTLTIAYAGLRTAMIAGSRYRTLLAAGLTSLLVAQAVLNLLMVLGLVPVIAVGMPFVSYGPANALSMFAAMGLLLGVTRPAAGDRKASAQSGAFAVRATRQNQRRVGLVFAAVLLLFATAALRSFWTSAIESSDLRAAADAQQSNTTPIRGLRGEIRDRHGFPLASAEPAFDVLAVPAEVWDSDEVTRLLGPLLDVDEGRLRGQLAPEAESSYIARGITPATAARVRGLDLAGVELLATQRRVHPRGPLAGQVVGAVGTEGDGLIGLERQYDAALRGVDGMRRIVTDAVRSPISEQVVSPAVHGEDVRVTLDAGLQERVEEALGDLASRWRPRGAAAVIMESRSGAVLAMASWPPLDSDRLEGESTASVLNRAIGLEYAPGSVFNPITIAGALAEEEATPSEVLDVPPSLTVADRLVESGAETAGGMTVEQIAKRSNDVGTALVALRLGPRRLAALIERFGFGRPTGIDLPGERGGSAGSGGESSIASIGSLSVGRGQLVTPLQLAAAYSALVNGGVLRVPRIVQRVGDRSFPPEEGQPVLSYQAAREMEQMLAGAEPRSSASPVVERDTGEYSDRWFVVSAIGLEPRARPWLVEVIVVDRPRGSGPRSRIAVRALEEINRFLRPYLGLAE